MTEDMPTIDLTLAELTRAVEEDAAIRRHRRLLPAGGPGDKIFPPTYPGENRNDPARHVFETRRIDGNDVRCVLIDSVQSQANRLEEALLDAIRDGRLGMPYVAVDFRGQKARLGSRAVKRKKDDKAAAAEELVPVDPDVKGEDYPLDDLGEVTSLDAPHRVFDAILRDSGIDGRPFKDTDIGARLLLANIRNATALFEISPSALVFGAWNSTGEGGGLGAKFPRILVAEIIGVGACPGRRVSSRIDPMGIRKDVLIYEREDAHDWTVRADEAKEQGGSPVLYKRTDDRKQPGRPSIINHGNIAPDVTKITVNHADRQDQRGDGQPINVTVNFENGQKRHSERAPAEDPATRDTAIDIRANGGVTIDYAFQSAVVTLAGLRRLRFPDGNGRRDPQRDRTARTVLAAMALAAITELDRVGYALRSRCDLIADIDEPSSFELIRADGTPCRFRLDASSATALLDAAIDAAKSAGFAWNTEPLRLVPQQRLVELVALSRAKALAGEGEPAGEGDSK